MYICVWIKIKRLHQTQSNFDVLFYKSDEENNFYESFFKQGNRPDFQELTWLEHLAKQIGTCIINRS